MAEVWLTRVLCIPSKPQKRHRNSCTPRSCPLFVGWVLMHMLEVRTDIFRLLPTLPMGAEDLLPKMKPSEAAMTSHIHKMKNLQKCAMEFRELHAEIYVRTCIHAYMYISDGPQVNDYMYVCMYVYIVYIYTHVHALFPSTCTL